MSNRIDFYSLDKLVDFGLGTDIAEQMTSSMNKTLADMKVPGLVKRIGETAELLYFVKDGRVAGPYSEAEFVRFVVDGSVTKGTLVWKPGMTGWRAAEAAPGVLALLSTTPPPAPCSE